MMSSIRLGCALALFLIAVPPVYAQEQLGIVTDNYAGINSVTLNPAAAVHSPFSWDCQPCIGSVRFWKTTMLIFQNTSFINLLKNTSNIRAATSINPDETLAPNTILFDFFDNSDRKFVYFNTEVMGPSVMFKVKDHTFGIYTAARTAVSANRIDESLGYYNFFAENPFTETFFAAPFKIGAMSWSEVGINYGRNVEDRHGQRFCCRCYPQISTRL